MRGPIDSLRSLLRELRRRRVLHTLVVYLVVAGGTVEVADPVFETLGIPSWTYTLLVLLAIIGVPVVFVLAWVYDVSTEGVRRTEEQPALGVRWVFAGFVIVVSLGMGGMAWALWLGPGADEGVDEGPVVEAARSDLDPARIAVLYFDDHSPDGSLQYLADGLTEGLIHELAQVEGLEVVSRNGVKPFRNEAVPLDSIVETLEAGSLVEGSVVRSGDGDRLRVTVQLVDGATDAHLASRVIEKEWGELFALQDSLTTEVSRELRRRLGTELRRRETRSRAESVEAWRLFRQALALTEKEFGEVRMDDPQGGLRVLHRADSLLVEASRLDSEWADPVVARAEVARLISHEVSSAPGAVADSAWNARALERAERAVAMSPQSPTAHMVRARVLMEGAGAASTGEAARLRDLAEEEVRRALALDPELAEASWLLARLSLERGRFAEAHQAARRALESDRFLELEAAAVHELYYSALNLEALDDARSWCNEGRRRFPANHRFVVCQLFIMVSAPQVEPDPGQAWRLADSLELMVAARNRERFDRYGSVLAAKVLARAGLADSARSVLRRTAGEEPPGWLTYDLAHAYLVLDDRDRAVEHLERYVEFDPSAREFLANDWWFRPLQGDPRFEALLEGG